MYNYYVSFLDPFQVSICFILKPCCHLIPEDVGSKT